MRRIALWQRLRKPGLVVVCGTLLGVLVSLAMADTIRGFPRPDMAIGWTMRGPASVRTVSQDDRELGASWAHAAGIERLEQCERASAELAEGCRDYVRRRAETNSREAWRLP
jgi:hypothetical protein